MTSFHLRLLAADHPVYEGACESVVIPTPQGQYGIWAYHWNMMTAVVPGVLRYRVPGQQEQALSVSEGLVKVEHNEVLVLVDAIERPEEIDANRARRAADEATEAMLQKNTPQQLHTAQSDLRRAISRLHIRNAYDYRARH